LLAATPSQPLLISIRYAFASCAAFSLALCQRAAMPRRRHYLLFSIDPAAFRDYFAIDAADFRRILPRLIAAIAITRLIRHNITIDAITLAFH
jgi:hypothetical protein